MENQKLKKYSVSYRTYYYNTNDRIRYEDNDEIWYGESELEVCRAIKDSVKNFKRITGIREIINN